MLWSSKENWNSILNIYVSNLMSDAVRKQGISYLSV